jgi:CheY-like chemotaxis protein
VVSKRDENDEAHPAVLAEHRLILVAEDDENDAFLLRKAFQKIGLTERLVFMSNGEEIVKYLQGEPPYERRDHPLPRLLLLDLKMPIVDGFDVLAWLKTQPSLTNLTTIVFSSSGEPEDIRKARSLGAADFQVKPGNFTELVKVVRQLELRWLKG